MIKFTVEKYLTGGYNLVDELYINGEHYKLLAIYPVGDNCAFYAFLFNTLTNSKETITIRAKSAQEIITKWNKQC